MSQEIFTNNATTTLGSSLSSGATTCTVASGTGGLFPSLSAGQFFSATLWAQGSDTGVPNEIVYVTARTGDTMTIVRAQEGTFATAWGVGDTFANYPTAAYFNGLLTSDALQKQATNSATDTGTANAGVITLSPVPANLAALLSAPIRVMKISSANTGAYTINVNGLGVKSVTVGGNALVAGQLPASQIFEIFWDGTNFELLSVPGVIATTGIADNAVTNGKLAQMPTVTVKANVTGGTANAVDVTLAAFAAALGLGGSANLATPKGHFTVPLYIAGVLTDVIVQWDNGTVSGSPQTIAFDIAFPNACLMVLPSDSGNSPVPWAAQASTYTTTGCALHSQGGAGAKYVYIAIGY